LHFVGFIEDTLNLQSKAVSQNTLLVPATPTVATPAKKF